MIEAILEKFKKVVSPLKYLVLVNIACSGMDLARGLLIAMFLGPANYGVTAVLASMHMFILSLMEFSMPDLAANLYYNTKLPPGPELRRYRGSVVQLCVLEQGAVALILVVVGTIITLLMVSPFTETPIKTSWIVANAAALGLKYWTSAFDYMKRFAGKFYLTGTWRFIGISASITVFLWIILKERNLDGFFMASFYSSLANFAIQFCLTIFMWLRYDKYRLLGRDLWASLPDYRKNYAFMYSGYMVSISRTLHFNTDALFVAYFCGRNDAVTGIYKLARNLTDRLALFTEALSQVYLPRCLELMAAKEKERFSAMVVKQILLALLATAVLMAGGAIAFPMIIKADILGFGKYAGVEMSAVAMTIPFFFNAGLYNWMWPMFIGSSKLNQFAFAAFAGVFAQYALSAFLFRAFSPSPVVASFGFVAYSLTVFPICHYLLSKEYSGYMPSLSALFKSLKRA